MAKDVSLMIIPTGQADTSPQILMFEGGIWRDMSPPVSPQSVGLTDIRNTIDTRLKELMAIVERGEVLAVGGLKAAFREYYRMLITSSVRQVLAEAAPAAGDAKVPVLHLHIHPAYEWIPWEMLCDGVDFLGLRFQIARLPIVAKGPDIKNDASHPVRRIYSLLGEAVFDDPQQQNWKETFNGLIASTAQTQEIRFPALNGAANQYPNVDQVMAASDADILHITCHGGLVDAQGQFYWTLNHQSLLSFTYHINSSIVKDLVLADKPLVFGNACASASGSGQSNAHSGLTPGFGAAFFTQGALNFIGTFAPITKVMAISFARKFYELLLLPQPGTDAGMTVGQTLAQTKKHFANGNDPSYLFYCLYGPPDTRFSVV